MSTSLLQELIDAIRCLPGVGPKTAQRMAFHLLKPQHTEAAQQLSRCIQQAITRIQRCEQCQLYTEHTLCHLCTNVKRDSGTICIVESPADVFAIEQSLSYHGHYFVLHGHLSPLDGIGPAELNLPMLFKRLSTNSMTELIIATNATMEGEATAYYITQFCQEHQLPCSRIAHGVPLGGELEYLDGHTLGHAIKQRALLDISQEDNT